MPILYVTKELCPECNCKKTNSPIKMWAKEFTKEDELGMANKHRKKTANYRWLDYNVLTFT